MHGRGEHHAKLQTLPLPFEEASALEYRTSQHPEQSRIGDAALVASTGGLRCSARREGPEAKDGSRDGRQQVRQVRA